MACLIMGIATILVTMLVLRCYLFCMSCSYSNNNNGNDVPSTHFGRRMRKKGRAGEMKQLSDCSDSHNKRLEKEEEEMVCEKRLERCRRVLAENQAALDERNDQRSTLRSSTSEQGSKAGVSAVVAPFPISSKTLKSSNRSVNEKFPTKIGL